MLESPCTWLVHFATIIANVTIAQAVNPNRAAAINVFRIGQFSSSRPTRSKSMDAFPLFDNLFAYNNKGPAKGGW
jgi:hypothetical protein